MKQFLKICIPVLFAAAVLTGCANEPAEDNRFHVYKPISGRGTNTDTPDAPVVTGDQDSTNYDYLSFKTTHSPYTMEMTIDGDSIKLSGQFDSDAHKFLLVTFERNSEEGKTPVEVKNRKYDSVLKIPSAKNEYVVEIYGGPERYGSFESIFIDYGIIRKTSDGWQFDKSPVYDHNLPIYNENKNPQDFIDATDRIQSDNSQIKSLANKITSDTENDYEKAKLIHDWTAKNIYYDMDALRSSDHSRMDAVSVLEDKKGVCEGYSNLVAALLRSVGIPCRIQGGYALGIDTSGQWNSSNVNTTDGNHAWNEAYIDGRWIIMDCTWDSKNKYENGSYNNGGEIGNVYFDSTLEFFSLSHKFLRD